MSGSSAMSRFVIFFQIVLAVAWLGWVPSKSGTTDPDETSKMTRIPELTRTAHIISRKEDLAVGWPQFRGPSMLATDLSANVPINWNDDQRLRWKTDVINDVKTRGASSPIVYGNRVYLTAFSGCGTSQQNRGNIADLKHHVICLDKLTGKTIWRRTIQGSYANRRLSEKAFGHGYASSTPLIEGNRLFAFFGVSGVFAFDLDGKLLWQTDVGTKSDEFGSSVSLSAYQDLLMVNASIEDETLYALDKTTGIAVWKMDGVIKSWSTPLVAETNAGEFELILNQQDFVRGLDPHTGEELWRCEGIHDYVVATPIAVDGVCYVTGGQHHQCMAIQLGGRGDVTGTHKIWQIRKGSNASSPVYHDGVLYTIATNGILHLIDAINGNILKRVRTGASKQILASATILGEYMFIPTQYRGVVVMNIPEECHIVAKNQLTDDDLPLQASIAVSDNNLYLRTDDHIYCVGHSGDSTAPVAQHDSTTQTSIIIPASNFEFDNKTLNKRVFYRCLVTEPQEILDFMLIPYKSVITPKQTAKSTEFILANHQLFIDFRQQCVGLRWEFMQGRIDVEKFATELGKIEDQTLQHNLLVRTFIKDMFSEEQMDQHLLEAGFSRKKPKSFCPVANQPSVARQ